MTQATGTLAARARLLSGAGFWRTQAAEGIRSLTLADGPHGLRRIAGGGDEQGLGTTAPATCFPPEAGLASSWSAELAERVGAAIGAEARQQGVDVVLGPGVNLKRSPLCGRNFEYFSEDPLLSAELGGAWVRGLQGQGVAASLKHFAVNNQETARMTVDAQVDERTLRELYLPAFERIVTREQPWTVMCAYNRINGTHASEHRQLLTDILRGEWGFDGLVVSDWGAVLNSARALAAGLDLEMPGPVTQAAGEITAALAAGELDELQVDAAIERLRVLAHRTAKGTPTLGGDHHALAVQAARESMVLLRNEGALLPLDARQSIAVIGELARTPRIQGAGSSQVVPTRVDVPLEALGEVSFASGYRLDRDATVPQLLAEAVDTARRADAVLLFAGLPASAESEGFDRTNLNLPAAQLELIAAVAAANPRTVVVLSNGGVVSLEPWHDAVPAILECWLLGQGAGTAIADIVFGVHEPSGRLAETIPLRLQDTPAYLNFPGEADVVRYGEGVFVGYRYHLTAEVPVRYPFGHGLGYTEFELGELTVSADGMRASATATNIGQRPGCAVPQLYVSSPGDGLAVPRRQLRAFAKVRLEPGESARVEFELEARSYQHWDPRVRGWVTAPGAHRVELGFSSEQIVASATVRRAHPVPSRLSLDSTVGQFLDHPVTGPVLSRAAGEEGGASVLGMVSSMPIRRLGRYPGAARQLRLLPLLIAVANCPPIRWIAARLQRR